MLPLPTGAELDILNVLWRLGPSTVREVHQALGTASGYTTTLKQMQVMTEKRLVLRSERYRSHVYSAGVPKEQTQQQIAGDLLLRAFEGSAKNLVLGALPEPSPHPKKNWRKSEDCSRILKSRVAPKREEVGMIAIHLLFQASLGSPIWAGRWSTFSGKVP